MKINTKGSQVIEIRRKNYDFDWELLILIDGKEIILNLTEEEVKWLELDLRKKLNEI